MINEADVKVVTEHLKPDILDVELKGRGGIRLRWEGPHHCTLEKLVDGKWVEMPFVQDIYIKIGVSDLLPRVTVRSVILPPRGRECESSSQDHVPSATSSSST